MLHLSIHQNKGFTNPKSMYMSPSHSDIGKWLGIVYTITRKFSPANVLYMDIRSCHARSCELWDVFLAPMLLMHLWEHADILAGENFATITIS